MYYWAILNRGPASEEVRVAYHLWQLLNQLARRIKRAAETVPRIRSNDNKEMVEDFVKSGERLTTRLHRLLNLCESPSAGIEQLSTASH